jgi:hypothetical protein
MRFRELDIGPGKPFSPFCRFQGTRHIGPWSDIDPSLVENGGDGGGPPFPLDLLPLPWRAWIADTARATGAPVDYVMQSVLAAVAGVCGAGVVARVSESWTEPLVLWQALVGRRSSGKSCALAPMHCLLAGLEAELKESDLGGDPRIVTTDPDSTAVSSRPQGVLLWRDDASSWFADLAEPARADDSGAISIVSVLGTMRPDRLLEALADENERFAAHFLYACADSDEVGRAFRTMSAGWRAPRWSAVVWYLCVGDGRLADDVVPAVDRYLATAQRRASRSLAA